MEFLPDTYRKVLYILVWFDQTYIALSTRLLSLITGAVEMIHLKHGKRNFYISQSQNVRCPSKSLCNFFGIIVHFYLHYSLNLSLAVESKPKMPVTSSPRFFPHYCGDAKGSGGQRRRSVADIWWGSAPTAQPDGRTDEDSRLCTAAIWPPLDGHRGHQQWDLHYSVKLCLRMQPRYYVSVRVLMLIHIAAQIPD